MSDPIAFRVLNEIGIINQLATTIFERSLPHGLTLAQFTVLNHFVRLGGTRSPGELASAFQVTKATITTTLQRLEVKGFVTSTPDATDGRSKRIGITDAGREAYKQSIEAVEHDLATLEVAIGGETLSGILPPLIALRSFLDRRRNGR